MDKLSSLKQLRYLVTLHEHQHFGRAAEASFISQSTLSAAITNLEEILAVQLLERDHKNFIFTPIGEEVVQKSRIILQQANELMDYTKSQGKPMQGKFYLGIIPTIAPFILSELQTACQKSYPLLTLLIREDTTENAIQYLKEGKLDAVVLALPFSIGEFYSKILVKDQFKLVLPKKWQNKNFDRNFKSLPEQSVFLLEKEHCMTGHSLEACQLKDSRKINPFSATSLYTLTQMVEYQPGVTFLPELAINSGLLDGTNLISLPIEGNEAYREIAIIWRNSSYRRESYTLLEALIKEILIKKCDLRTTA